MLICADLLDLEISKLLVCEICLIICKRCQHTFFLRLWFLDIVSLGWFRWVLPVCCCFLFGFIPYKIQMIAWTDWDPFPLRRHTKATKVGVGRFYYFSKATIPRAKQNL
jgi:hypothetical protein